MSISKENFEKRLLTENQFKNLNSLYKLTNENINMLFNENENKEKTIRNILAESIEERSATKLRLAKKQNPGMNNLHYLENNRSGAKAFINEYNNVNNMVNHNCFLLGHGMTIKNQYIITPNNIYLKFYTPKGNSLTGVNSTLYLSEYSNNPVINESSHYLHPDSVTHNMSIKLLSFYSYLRKKRTGNFMNDFVLGDVPIEYIDHSAIIGHSGIIVGSKIKPFHEISQKEYKKMGIRLLVNPRANMIILDFGENIYGIYDLDEESFKGQILIINNTPNIESNEAYTYYLNQIRFTLEYYFAKKFGYPHPRKYTPEMTNTVERLFRTLELPIGITNSALQKMINLSFYNHNKKYNENKDIISFDTIKTNNYTFGLGEIFNYITQYNRRVNSANQITLCQGLVCRSWNITSELGAGASALNSVRIRASNNIGYARLTRTLSNSRNYKDKFRHIIGKCKNNIRKLNSSNNTHNRIIEKYNEIIVSYKTNFYLNIRQLNFIVNLAHNKIASVTNMSNKNLS